MRLLIGAGSFADAKPALRIAEALLGSDIGDISGVLIEELQDVEALPTHAQCIITPSGVVCDAPPLEERRRILESDARAFRNSLKQLAKRSAARWEFGRKTGDPVQQLLSMHLQWNLLVVGHRNIGRQTGCVLTMRPKDEGPTRTRSLSQTLSQRLRTEILELDPGLSESSLIATVSRTSAAALVIESVTSPLRSDHLIRKLFEAARCPVLIVGPSKKDDRKQ